MKNKFSMAMSLALIMSMLFNSLALADDVVPDGDIATAGNQSTVILGNVAPGAVLTPQASFSLVCDSSKHVDSGQTLNFTFSLAGSTVPAGGNLSATNASVGPMPGGWPDDTTGSANCASISPNPDNGNSTVTITAPSTPGPYSYTVRYVHSLSPSGLNDSSSVKSNHTDVTYTLTVAAPAVQNQTITFGTLGIKTYGDADFNVSATASSGLPVSFTASGACTVSGNTVNITGAGSCTITASQAGNASYNAAPDVSRSFNIAKAGANISVSGYSGVYDGAAHGATGSATGVGGANLSGQLNLGASFTNVPGGTANWTFSGGSNYNDASGNAAIVISAASSSVAVTCGGPYIYTGSELTPCTASFSTADGLSGSLTPTYSANVNVGTATASASYAGDANHANSSNSATFQIAKAGSSVTVVCSVPNTYTGSTIEPCTASFSTTDGLSGSLTPSYSGNVNAGTATASASYAGDANHEGSSDSENFTIDQASSVTTVTCGAGPFTYNGLAQTPCAVTVTGTGDLNLTPAPVYADNVNAGTASASYTFAGDANHTGSSDSETFAIGKATSTTVVSCEAGPFTYDGSAITPCSVAVTGAGALNLTPAPVYADNVNAGTASASYTYAGDANHNSSSDSKNFTIAKASSATVLTCPSNVTYTGLALEPCSATVTGAGGLNASVAVVYADNTNAGPATASATFAGDANHNGSSDSKNFTIDKAASTTVVTCPASVTYNGAAQTSCSASATGVGGLNQSLTVSYADNTNAGTATASASFAGGANHDGSSDSETFEIAKAPVTATAGSGASTYDGATHAPSACAVTGDYTGDLTCANSPASVGPDAGTTAIAPVVSGTGLSNFEIASVNGMYTINQAPSATVVTCPASVYFTGLPQTPCSAVVTGVGGLNQSLTVNYSNNTAVGTATASATYAGDLNHTASSGSKNFQILAWTLNGFFQPVDMSPVGGPLVYNTVKNGSTVPLKFEIFAGSTELNLTSYVKSLTYAQTSCDATATTDDIETTATGGTSLRYDTTGGQFIYNWKTPATVGKCYRVTMETQDGSKLVAYFKLK